MKKFLSEILIDPETAKPLVYDPTQNILRTGDHSATYEVLEDVPVILPPKNSLVASSLHRNFETNFDYAAHYEEDAKAHSYFKQEENASTKNEMRRLHEAIINAVPKDARLILDVGCGNGWLSNYFLQKDRQVISMDISLQNPAAVLKENAHVNHAALTADVFSMPIKNNTLNCIVAAEIMEHVPDPGLFIEKLVEKLRPGGSIIITTPYNEKIEYYLCVHCNLPTPKNAHLHSFNKKNIKTIITTKKVTWRSKTFANKYLIKTRLNLLMSFLPFSTWRAIDRFTDIIFTSPTRFIIEIIKKP